MRNNTESFIFSFQFKKTSTPLCNGVHGQFRHVQSVFVIKIIVRDSPVSDIFADWRFRRIAERDQIQNPVGMLQSKHVRDLFPFMGPDPAAALLAGFPASGAGLEF